MSMLTWFKFTSRWSATLGAALITAMPSLTGCADSGGDSDPNAVSSNGGSLGMGGLGGSAQGGVSTGGVPSTSGSSATGGSVATGGGSNAPTWSVLYSRFFASGTAGDCVSCHGAGTSPSYSNATTMCTALRNAGFIGNGTATLNLLLAWFNQGGSMPANGNPAPPNAVTSISAWQQAGAVCP